MARSIELKTHVMTKDGEYEWGGVDPDRIPGWQSVSYSLLHGGLPVIRCDMDMVAPVEVADKVDLKDPRILVEKLEKPGGWAAGPWKASRRDDPEAFQTWHKTKRDGVEKAARRLAISDWHAEVTV